MFLMYLFHQKKL